jgi:diguanylate cyclase (GGDEF)-like protein
MIDASTFGPGGHDGDGAALQRGGDELGRRETDDHRRSWLSMPDASPALKWLYALMGVLLVGYVASTIVRRQLDGWPVVDGWGVAGFELLASLLCIARGLTGVQRARAARLVSLVLGTGLLFWAVGDSVVAAAGLGPTASTPLAANVLYLGFYPFAYVGVMLRLHMGARRLSTETWLDGLIAGLGAAAFAAAFLLRTVMHSAGGGSAEMVATNLAYPIGDVLLLALVVGGSAVIAGRRGLPWIMLAAGLAVNTLGDTANLLTGGLGSTHFAAVLDAAAWPTSILLVSLAVWVRPRSAAPAVREPSPSFVLPALACGLSMALLFAGSLEHVSVTALALALATLAAAGIRAGLSVRSLQRVTVDKHLQAHTDQLTRLANRRALFELLDALEEEHRTTGECRRLACLFVDLNRFKEINDSFGHSVGDELLHQIGRRLGGILRDGDLLARLGGDEFVVALLDADGERGAAIAQRIGARLEQPFQIGAVRAQIGASIGIAVAPADATGGARLLRCADLAMYRAKIAGQAFATYSEELDGRGSRLDLVEDLRGAIASRTLELHFQPQIECGSGAIVALEALVRWEHPRLGYLPPLEFLGLAEDAELMDPLTQLVLDRALAQCARWRAAGSDVAVCVNLSSTNLHNPQLPAIVRDALARHHLAPSALVLEVTETTAITDFDRSQETIGRLRDLGLVVSIDDFGAGFTSLAHLSSLAVDELKLDRSFVQGLVSSHDPRNQALVRSTIELAHALGLRVVAEGIEDEESFELLTELGSDRAQGYLIGRPRPADELDLHAGAFRLPGRALRHAG